MQSIVAATPSIIQATEGYKKLVVWKNARELRLKVYQATALLPKSEFRRVSQMRDAARSVKQNIQEGYGRRSSVEYVRFLEISRGSLAELQGDLEDCFEDGLLSADIFGDLYRLCKRTDYIFARLLQSLNTKQLAKRSTLR
jgi:four helix bundle protein